MLLNIGIDDTDSEIFGCTTHVAANIVFHLDGKRGIRFLDYPLIVRLNPNIPWKTRGNGAVSIRIELSDEIEAEAIKEFVLNKVKELSDLSSPRSEPAIAFSHRIPKRGDELHQFYLKALRSMVAPVKALEVAEKIGVSCNFLKNSKVGAVGALAAVGALFDDYTFELLSYRAKGNYGKPRRIDLESVYIMDRSAHQTFNNIDPETGRILITPHGSDPVLFGIRGETPEAVYNAFRMVRAEEEIERWCIFKTNQGTDAHFPEGPIAIDRIRKYDSTFLEGSVVDKKVIIGGHVIITLENRGSRIFCAFYSPTGSLKKTASELEVGDRVRIYGGVKEHSGNLTVNAEKMEVLRLCKKTQKIPPMCPKCGRKCKNLGLRQGFICKRCGERIMEYQVIEEERKLKVNYPYLPPERAHRHLTKPLKRYGHEKFKLAENYGFISPWHSP